MNRFFELWIVSHCSVWIHFSVYCEKGTRQTRSLLRSWDHSTDRVRLLWERRSSRAEYQILISFRRSTSCFLATRALRKRKAKHSVWAKMSYLWSASSYIVVISCWLLHPSSDSFNLWSPSIHIHGASVVGTPACLLYDLTLGCLTKELPFELWFLKTTYYSLYIVSGKKCSTETRPRIVWVFFSIKLGCHFNLKALLYIWQPVADRRFTSSWPGAEGPSPVSAVVCVLFYDLKWPQVLLFVVVSVWISSEWWMLLTTGGHQ